MDVGGMIETFVLYRKGTKNLEEAIFALQETCGLPPDCCTEMLKSTKRRNILNFKKREIEALLMNKIILDQEVKQW